MAETNATSAKRALPRIAVGNDSIFPVVVYRKGVQASLDEPAPEDTLVRPEEMEDLTITLVNEDGCGKPITPAAVTPHGGQLLVELSGEQTRACGAGVYRLDLSYNERSDKHADGKRLITLSRKLCRVVTPREASVPPTGEVRMEVAPTIQGEPGEPGKNGAPGLNAYEWAESQGLVSTPEQFVELLRGATGNPGTDGKSAYELAVRAGYTGSETDWLASLKGVQGDKGDSAYRVAVSNGYTGSEADWLESLHGDTGKSAYQSYLDTTDDDPKLSERDWAKTSDYVYQFIHLLIYGTSTPQR